MGHVISSHLAITFGIVILAVCAVLVFHVVFTGLKKHKAVNKTTEYHAVLAHSLSMSLGMISSMCICIVIGALMAAMPSAAYIVGFIVGFIVGSMISLPYRSIAILDGMVAGVMGGLMGVILGTMMPKTALYAVSILLVTLFGSTWIVMYQLIFRNSKAIK